MGAPPEVDRLHTPSSAMNHAWHAGMSGRTFFDEDILREQKVFLSHISVFEHLSKQTFTIAYGEFMSTFSRLADGGRKHMSLPPAFMTLTTVLVKTLSVFLWGRFYPDQGFQST